jgi:hypothetical protein
MSADAFAALFPVEIVEKDFGYVLRGKQAFAAVGRFSSTLSRTLYESSNPAFARNLLN